ncbi:MAG: hemerythrin domain-containing protein [Gammaproteobacteria bacterium]
MPEILARLEREHRDFGRLLDLLDGQLARLGRGEDADFRIMSDIMQYVGVYPDMVHLPTEALVVRCLIDRDATQARIGGELLAEHDTLRRLGHAFNDLVQRVLGGAIVPLDRVRSVGHEYLDLCRGHARLGEREVFPRAREVLAAEDWDRIRAEITSATDPLFGDIVDQSYQHLYDMIERER